MVSQFYRVVYNSSNSNTGEGVKFSYGMGMRDIDQFHLIENENGESNMEQSSYHIDNEVSVKVEMEGSPFGPKRTIKL